MEWEVQECPYLLLEVAQMVDKVDVVKVEHICQVDDDGGRHDGSDGRRVESVVKILDETKPKSKPNDAFAELQVG